MTKDEFIRIVATHQKLIYKVCNTYCSDVFKREDLEQEILLQLWTSIDRFDGRVKLSTWVYKVALNTAIAFYRRDARQHQHSSQLDESIFSMPDDNEADERLDLLNTLIRALPVNDRAIMLLYLDEFKYKDIGEMVGISETNVATKISRIKKQLKESISRHLKLQNNG